MRYRDGSETTEFVVAVSDSGHAIGEDHPRARYTNADVEGVFMLHEAGFSLRQISKKMDMPIRTIRDYLSGRRRDQSIAGFKKVRRKRV